MSSPAAVVSSCLVRVIHPQSRFRPYRAEQVEERSRLLSKMDASTGRRTIISDGQGDMQNDIDFQTDRCSTGGSEQGITVFIFAACLLACLLAYADCMPKIYMGCFSNIPHTYVSANCFAAYFGANLSQIGTLLPPKEKVHVYGDGNAKGIFVDEDDVGTYVIKSIDDPRSLNKTIYIYKPPENIFSQNELIAKWEKLSGKVLEKIPIPSDEFLASMEGADHTYQIVVGHVYHIFYEGCLTNFEIADDEEASLLYPEVQYTLMDKYMERYF
ncbi:isoflavone reductase homolog [Lolium rigidum]|uniref:isoflavone reductase homolog n=1 Tax=Lolium rigidum TaxID=89674 RepID=UPI001F5DB60C|nr:isoflavone reductase homolog [Lolium rigidum]